MSGSDEDDLPGTVPIYGSKELGQEAIVRTGSSVCWKKIYRFRTYLGQARQAEKFALVYS